MLVPYSQRSARGGCAARARTPRWKCSRKRQQGRKRGLLQRAASRSCSHGCTCTAARCARRGRGASAACRGSEQAHRSIAAGVVSSALTPCNQMTPRALSTCSLLAALARRWCCHFCFCCSTRCSSRLSLPRGSRSNLARCHNTLAASSSLLFPAHGRRCSSAIRSRCRQHTIVVCTPTITIGSALLGRAPLCGCSATLERGLQDCQLRVRVRAQRRAALIVCASNTKVQQRPVAREEALDCDCGNL